MYTVEWIEFTPYEVAIPKYGCAVKPEDFGCKFFKGHIVKRFPELPLHFLQGIAFSLHLSVCVVNVY